MEERYDYFRHKYCITFMLGCKSIFTEIRPVNSKDIVIPFSCRDTLKDHELVNFIMAKREEDISFFYNAATKTVISRSSLDFCASKELEGNQDFIYIHNMFVELNNTYQRSQEPLYKYTAQDSIFRREAINVLQQTVYHWIIKLDGSNIDFYFAFILPTNWNYHTREELIRPLFIEAGLIHENDSQDRMIFFTELESSFRSMQEEDYVMPSLEIKLGNQFVLCTLDCQEKGFSVNLELVSTQYPSLTAKNTNYVPQLLKAVHFTMPFGAEELRSSLMACLKERCHTILLPETTDRMIERITSNSFFNYLGNTTPLEEVLCYQPFSNLVNLSDKRYNLKSNEINAIQSIAMEDIYKNLPNPVEKFFKDQMSMFLQSADNTKNRSTIICSTYQLLKNDLKVVPRLIEKWSKVYSQEQTNSYQSKAINEVYFSDLEPSRHGARLLVETQMQEFIICRDPIILSKETATVQPEISLKPVFFVNIDMSFTKIKTAMTYFDENRQIQQTENIDCNIKPLNTFIIQSELYQRPILQISKRMKQYLDDIFGSYLLMDSDFSEQNEDKKIPINPTSKLLSQVSQKVEIKSATGNYLRTKADRKQLKGIRKLFVTSRPNLLKQLMEKIEIKELFTSKNEEYNDNNDLVIVCYPGYIYFFMLLYLYTLNKLLEEKIYAIFGNDWRVNNIWYGVSIDKNLLDNVFGSVKKLKKLFFGSGILERDNDLRKAKFCTRGEELLPAIQQKLGNLNVKIKSYFIVTQIFSTHVQLTLHQVVKLASSGKNAATIVIQDEIVYINNVYDALCKKFMNNMQDNYEIDHCVAHKYKQHTRYNFGSLKTYSYILQNLKPCVVQLLKMNKERLDMDSEIKLNINDKCDCNITIFFRNIIEIGLKPTMEDIATIIAASLINKRLFGNYEIDHLFVLGDPFDLSYRSLIHNIYTIITQKAINDGVQLKEKDTQTFVLEESFRQLMEPVTSIMPYIYNRFITGTLCQVSNNTYAMRVLKDMYSGIPFSVINCDNEGKGSIEGNISHLVLIQKEKPIPKTGFRLEYDRIYAIEDTIDDSSHWVPIYHLEIIQLKRSDDIIKGRCALLLETNVEGSINTIYLKRLSYKTTTIVECKYINYDYSIEISVRFKGDNVKYNSVNRKPFKRFLEPLTLAYI